MTDKPGSVPPPLCKAILLCERVDTDPITRQFNLHGVFDTFHLDSFPGCTIPFAVFPLLAGSQGGQEVWVEVHDLKSGHKLGHTSLALVPFPGRADCILQPFACAPLFLPSPGGYDLVVHGTAGEIDRLRFAAQTSLE